MDTPPSRELRFVKIVGKNFPKSESKLNNRNFSFTMWHLKDHKLNPSGKTGAKQNSKL